MGVTVSISEASVLFEVQGVKEQEKLGCLQVLSQQNPFMVHKIVPYLNQGEISLFTNLELPKDENGKPYCWWYIGNY